MITKVADIQNILFEKQQPHYYHILLFKKVNLDLRLVEKVELSHAFSHLLETIKNETTFIGIFSLID